MSEDLQPCPFCGQREAGDPGVFLIGDYYVHCRECGAEGPLRDSEADAVAAWNRRAGQQGEARPAREDDERTEFEAWVRADTTCSLDRSKHFPDQYDDNIVQWGWSCWNVRAALATQAAPAAHPLSSAAPDNNAPAPMALSSEAQAEPAGGSDPVAEVFDAEAIFGQTLGLRWRIVDGRPPAGTKLYTRAAASGERDNLRALLREARGPLSERDLYEELVGRIDAALADGGAR